VILLVLLVTELLEVRGVQAIAPHVEKQ
jgi:hypothetical protein